MFINKNQASELNRGGNRLWKYRKIKDLNQKQIALFFAYRNSSVISSWEKGKSLPNLKNALMLSHILRTPVESLFPSLSVNIEKEITDREKALKKSFKKRK
jgi:DNA-binding XRE family transcriptional regulator